MNDKAGLISKAKVTARFTGGDTSTPIPDTPLFDDGAHNDLLANDGVYGANVFIPASYFNTIVQVQYLASGKGVSLATNLFIRFRVQ